MPTQHVGHVRNVVLNRGDAVVSPGKAFTLLFQEDGNLVLYVAGPRTPYAKALWNSHTQGRGDKCHMQPDGNLVIYAPGNAPIWASQTAGHGNARLYVQDDGNVVIYNGSVETGAVLWHTNTHAG